MPAQEVFPGLSVWETTICPCGHRALDHHGLSRTDGCLGVASHKRPQCPCSLTATDVINEGRKPR